MSSLLNGPVTLCAVILGSIANILTIYVLSVKTLQRHRTSIYNSPLPPPKKFSSSITQSDRFLVDLLSQRRRHTQSHSGIITSNRPRVYTFFVWLAISDTFLLLSALLMYSIPNLLHGQLGIYVRFFPYFYLMSNTALTTSVWLMCALMADRYRTLSSPFAMRSSNISLVHRVLFTICVVALVFSLPRFFELHLEKDPVNGAEYVSQTELVHNKAYMVGYRILGGLMLYSLLPYAILFILSFKVWLVIRSAAMTRLKISASSTTSHSMVLYSCATDSEMILIAVTSKFLLSRLIPTMLDVVEHVVGPSQFTRSSTLTLCVDVSNLVVVSSSGINLFIFYAFSASFRKQLVLLLSGGVVRGRSIITSPLSNLSTVTMAPNGREKSIVPPKLPRQLSLQAERRCKPNELKRKTTVAGVSLSKSTRNRSSLVFQQQAVALLRMSNLKNAGGQQKQQSPTKPVL